MQCFLSKPVAFSKAAEVDRLPIGQLFPGHINLQKEENERERGKGKQGVTGKDGEKMTDSKILWNGRRTF